MTEGSGSEGGAQAPPAPTGLLRFELLAASVAGIGVLAMMLLGGLDVLTTNVNRPIPGAYEIIETLMVASIFLALALSQAQGRQIRVELITDRMAPRSRDLVQVFSDACSLTVYGFIAWYGAKAAWTSTLMGEVSSGAVQFPLWPAKIALTLGAVLMVLQCLASARTSLKQALSPRG